MLVITKHGDNVDNLCYQVYGFTQGMNEKVLEANPGLAARGPIFPAGITVQMPSITTTKTVSMINLWD